MIITVVKANINCLAAKDGENAEKGNQISSIESSPHANFVFPNINKPPSSPPNGRKTELMKLGLEHAPTEHAIHQKCNE